MCDKDKRRMQPNVKLCMMIGKDSGGWGDNGLPDWPMAAPHNYAFSFFFADCRWITFQYLAITSYHIIKIVSQSSNTKD